MDDPTQDKLDRMYRLVDSLANDMLDIVETYEVVRIHAIAVAEYVIRQHNFEALFKLSDAKFMGIYRRKLPL